MCLKSIELCCSLVRKATHHPQTAYTAFHKFQRSIEIIAFCWHVAAPNPLNNALSGHFSNTELRESAFYPFTVSLV